MCISHIVRRRAPAHFKKTKCVWLFTFGVNGTVYACIENEPDILNNDIDRNEIIKVIQNLPNCKSPGTGVIAYELIRHATNTIVESLYSLFNLILKTGIFPTRCEAIISPCTRKGLKLTLITIKIHSSKKERNMWLWGVYFRKY